MSVQSQIKRQTVRSVNGRKGGTPLVCLTAASAPIARLADGCADLVLVGDSLGTTIYGFPTTISVSLEMMIAHGRAVVRATGRALIVIDLPFGSYEESPRQAFRTAARVLKETGAAAVKLEGGSAMADTIAFLTERGVPVLAHIGLQPQQVNLKGFRVAGRTESERKSLLADARAIETAGAFAVVLEGMMPEAASTITKALAIPTIGIGASPDCDGQILVTEDLLGLLPKPPRFVRRYAELGQIAGDALATYASDVQARRFPGPEHVYADPADMPKPAKAAE